MNYFLNGVQVGRQTNESGVRGYEACQWAGQKSSDVSVLLKIYCDIASNKIAIFNFLV
jgi:hypothetical protein